MKFMKTFMVAAILLSTATKSFAVPNHNAVASDKQMLGTASISTMVLVENKSCDIKISVNGELKWEHGCDTTNLAIFKNDHAMVQFYNGEKPPYAFGMHIDHIDLNNKISYFTIDQVYAGKDHSYATGKCIGNLNTNGFICKSSVIDGQNSVDMEFSTSGGKKTIINNN